MQSTENCHKTLKMPLHSNGCVGICLDTHCNSVNYSNWIWLYFIEICWFVFRMLGAYIHCTKSIALSIGVPILTKKNGSMRFFFDSLNHFWYVFAHQQSYWMESHLEHENVVDKWNTIQDFRLNPCEWAYFRARKIMFVCCNICEWNICGALEHNVIVVNLFFMCYDHFSLISTHSIALRFKSNENKRREKKKNMPLLWIFWQSESICHRIETSNLPHATTN